MRKSIILHKQDVLPLSIVWQCQQKPPATEKCLQSLSELWWSTGHRCAGINHQLWLSPRLPALPYSWRENSQLSIFVHIIAITHPPIAVVMSKPLSCCVIIVYRVSAAHLPPSPYLLLLLPLLLAFKYLHICLTSVAYTHLIVLWILIQFVWLQLNCTNKFKFKDWDMFQWRLNLCHFHRNLWK